MKTKINLKDTLIFIFGCFIFPLLVYLSGESFPIHRSPELVFFILFSLVGGMWTLCIYKLTTI